MRAIADNVELDPGTGGAVIATDDAGAGGHVQINKLAISADGSATAIPADATNGLDVDVTRVQGTVTVTGALTDTQLRATPVPVSGTVTATTGGLTDTQLRATAVPVSGTVTASGPLTDTQLRAAAVPVSLATLPALVAGSAAIGKLAANSGVDIGDVDVTSISAGTNAIGNVGIVPRTTGGLTPLRLLDIDETEDDIKTSAGQLFGWYLYNDGAAEVYVKFFNATAANVTVGTTTPVMVLPIPAGAAANVFTEIGIAFSTAISVAATTGAADNDVGAPATNQVVGTVYYA